MSGEGQGRDAVKEIKKRVRKGAGQLDWLNRGLEAKGTSLLDILRSDKKPHAEMKWMVGDAADLLAYIKSKKSAFEALPECDDDFSFDQLTRFPRIEFVISSSCCSNCRCLIGALRLELNKRKTNVPIIVYTKDATNKDEQDGRVYVVGKEGDFIDTQLCCDTHPPAPEEAVFPGGQKEKYHSTYAQAIPFSLESTLNFLTFMLTFLVVCSVYQRSKQQNAFTELFREWLPTFMAVLSSLYQGPQEDQNPVMAVMGRREWGKAPFFNAARLPGVVKPDVVEEGKNADDMATGRGRTAKRP